MTARTIIFRLPIGWSGRERMRRGVGIGGLQKQAAAKDTFRQVGNVLHSAQLEQLRAQLEVFKKSLEDFSRKYQKDIAKNPLLRSHFQKMCTAIGVDPLVSSKGFWAEVLGVGDFYYELGIQIVETCLVLQEQTGGLTDLSAIKTRLHRLRKTNVAEEDICRAVDTLKPLGSGYSLIELGGRKIIQSVPLELSADGTLLLRASETRGYIVENDYITLGWQHERFQRAIDSLLSDGIAWVDSHDNSVTYWFPCFFPGFT